MCFSIQVWNINFPENEISLVKVIYWIWWSRNHTHIYSLSSYPCPWNILTDDNDMACETNIILYYHCIRFYCNGKIIQTRTELISGIRRVHADCNSTFVASSSHHPHTSTNIITFATEFPAVSLWIKVSLGAPQDFHALWCYIPWDFDRLKLYLKTLRFPLAFLSGSVYLDRRDKEEHQQSFETRKPASKTRASMPHPLSSERLSGAQTKSMHTEGRSPEGWGYGPLLFHNTALCLSLEVNRSPS